MQAPDPDTVTRHFECCHTTGPPGAANAAAPLSVATPRLRIAAGATECILP